MSHPQGLKRPPTTIGVDAVVAELRPRHKRHGLSKRELLVGLPLMIAAFVVVIVVVVWTFLYAAFGSESTFLNPGAAPTDPPAPVGGRVIALVLCVVFLVVLGAFVWSLFRQLHATHVIALDSQGTWLARGRRVQHGLRWHQVAAISVTPASATTAPTSVPSATADSALESHLPPYVELFPADPVENAHSPLGSRVFTGPAPTDELRPERYLIELANPSEAANIAAAVDRFAAEKHIRHTTS